MRNRVCGALSDALEAGERIMEATEGLRFSDYEDDWQLSSAVERQFEIIGEALNRVRRSDTSVIARIPGSEAAIGLRNVIIHEYDRVDNDLLWEIVKQRLPSLCDTLRRLIQEYHEAQP